MFRRVPQAHYMGTNKHGGNAYIVVAETQPEYDGGHIYREDVLMERDFEAADYTYELAQAFQRITRMMEDKKALHDSKQVESDSGTGTVGSDLRAAGPC
jgi:hypothetical protein